MVFCAVLVTACGFHLRGAVAIPASYVPLYVEQNRVFEVANDLKGLLRGSHIDFVDHADEARSSIVLRQQVKRRRILSVDENGRAREYQLIYTLSFSFHAGDSRPFDDTIQLSRSLLFDANQVLAVNEESDTLYRDMQRDAARLVLLRFRAWLNDPAARRQPSPLAGAAADE